MSVALAPVSYAPRAWLQSWREHGCNPPTVQYAQGNRCDLDPEEPAVQLVNAWIAAGDALHHNGRHPVTGAPLCLVRMLSAAEKGAGPGAAGPAGELLPPDRRMLDALRTYAGEPLPNNHVLARQARHRNAVAASYRLRRLCELGLIRMRRERDKAGRELRFADFPKGV